MTRRRFAFWLGFGLFSLAEQLRVQGLDDIAAAITGGAKDPSGDSPAVPPEHWAVASNRTWWWYRRETWIDNQWILTGITTPINKKTGKPLVGGSGYLDPSLVPDDVWVTGQTKAPVASEETNHQHGQGQADPARRARHGRPPSKWLRSLHADELRIWLKTIDVPEAGVSGMTFWTHLTRDHSFDPEKIEGLTIDEQAQLHAAAHYGY